MQAKSYAPRTARSLVSDWCWEPNRDERQNEAIIDVLGWMGENREEPRAKRRNLPDSDRADSALASQIRRLRPHGSRPSDAGSPARLRVPRPALRSGPRLR
jgi:hypothetical protein